MNYKLYPFTLIAALSLFSCANNDKDEEPISTFKYGVVDSTVNKTTTSSTGASASPSATAITLPGTPANTQALPANTGANSLITNPAHGAPGHRCDIAVGAPLNSKPMPAATPAAAIQATSGKAPMPTMVNAPVPIAQKTATGANPAHGQPGHRCDIAVGAPLNSKPTIKPTPTDAIKPTAAPTVATPAQKVAPGMNPAHGEPGHRCDIAVGASLTSKPSVPAAAKNASPPKTDSSKN